MKKPNALKTSKFRTALKEYRVELISMAVIAIGIFLVVERLEIRKTVKIWARQLYQWTGQALTNLFDRVVGYITDFTLSDLTGLILILMASAYIFWRVRVRLLKRLHWPERVCPRCQNPVNRIHRKWLDRLWGFLLMRPLHRYSCSNPACEWSGLRYGAHQRSQPMKEAKPG